MFERAKLDRYQCLRCSKSWQFFMLATKQTGTRKYPMTSEACPECHYYVNQWWELSCAWCGAQFCSTAAAAVYSRRDFFCSYRCIRRNEIEWERDFWNWPNEVRDILDDMQESSSLTHKQIIESDTMQLVYRIGEYRRHLRNWRKERKYKQEYTRRKTNENREEISLSSSEDKQLVESNGRVH